MEAVIELAREDPQAVELVSWFLVRIRVGVWYILVLSARPDCLDAAEEADQKLFCCSNTLRMLDWLIPVGTSVEAPVSDLIIPYLVKKSGKSVTYHDPRLLPERWPAI